MIANALPTAVADADTLPFGGIDHAESRNSYQGDQVIVVSHESKLDIKKEICDDENLQRTVNTFDVSAKLSADVADSSNDVVKVTTNQEPQRESKRRISENFDQFWTLVRPKVLSNLSLWTFLSDKTRFQSTSTTEERRQDVEKLDFLLHDVENLIEQVSELIRTCCSNADDVPNNNDGYDAFSDVTLRGNLSKLLHDHADENVRRVRLKRRNEIPDRFRENIFSDVGIAETEDLADVSFNFYLNLLKTH